MKRTQTASKTSANTTKKSKPELPFNLYMDLGIYTSLDTPDEHTAKIKLKTHMFCDTRLVSLFPWKDRLKRGAAVDNEKIEMHITKLMACLKDALKIIHKTTKLINAIFVCSYTDNNALLRCAIAISRLLSETKTRCNFWLLHQLPDGQYAHPSIDANVYEEQKISHANQRLELKILKEANEQTRHTVILVVLRPEFAFSELHMRKILAIIDNGNARIILIKGMENVAPSELYMTQQNLTAIVLNLRMYVDYCFGLCKAHHKVIFSHENVRILTLLLGVFSAKHSGVDVSFLDDSTYDNKDI